MTIDDDFSMLRQLVAKATELDELDDDESEFLFPENARRAFREMLDRGRPLSDRQRAWVRGVYEKVFDTPTYENEVSAGKVPRGREVVLLVDAMPKPLKPPRRTG